MALTAHFIHTPFHVGSQPDYVVLHRNPVFNTGVDNGIEVGKGMGTVGTV